MQRNARYIALPPPVPLDLPKLGVSKKITLHQHQQVVIREEPLKTGSGLGVVSGIVLSGDRYLCYGMWKLDNIVTNTLSNDILLWTIK